MSASLPAGHLVVDHLAHALLGRIYTVSPFAKSESERNWVFWLIYYLDWFDFTLHNQKTSPVRNMAKEKGKQIFAKWG